MEKKGNELKEKTRRNLMLQSSESLHRKLMEGKLFAFAKECAYQILIDRRNELPVEKRGELERMLSDIYNKWLKTEENGSESSQSTPDLISTESELPSCPFPTNAFCEQVQQIIIDTNRCLNFPVDFMGASILFTSSLAIGNTVRLTVKENWEESSMLFIANIGRPNTNKSHPVSFALKPIFQYDSKTYKEYRDDLQVYKNALVEAKKEGKLPDVPKPIWFKHIVDDFTPEVLADTLNNNMRGIGVYADELAGWFKNFNRYNKSGEQERWLKIWSCKQISIDRKSSEPILITMPFVPIIGNIQTGVLGELGKDNRTQNGLIDRMLFAFPENLQKQPISDEQLNPEIGKTWEAIVNKLLSIELQYDEEGNPNPHKIKFSDEAWKLYKEWEADNTKLCNETGDERLAAIYGKFDIHFFRISLILQMLNWATSEETELPKILTVDSVKGCIELVKYFQSSATRAHQILSVNSNPVERLPEYKRRFYEKLPDTFKVNEIIGIADSYEINPRTMKRILGDITLFKRLKQGKYEKLYK